VIAWLSRAARIRSIAAQAVVALCVVAVVLWSGRPAWADATISLALAAPPGIVSSEACAQFEAVPGHLLWTFEVRDTVLAVAGELTALTATFLTPDGKVEVTARPASDDIYSNTGGESTPPADPTLGDPTLGDPTLGEPTPADPTPGDRTPGDPTSADLAPTPPTSAGLPSAGLTASTVRASPVPGFGLDGRQGWVSTPVEWQLATATADITGTAGYLELVGFCSAEGVRSGATAAMTPPAPTLAAATKRPTLLGTAVKEQAPRTTTTPPIGPHASAARTALPITGTDVGGMLALGTSLVLAGVLLLIGRRQRMRVASGPERADERRTVVVTWRD
jgi:hypothetical protein